MRKLYLFGFLILAILLISACSTSISKITKHGDRFDGKKVVVKGTVINTLHLDDLNYFVLKNGKAKINVITNDFLPVVNDHVKVKGQVINKFYYQRDTNLVVREIVKPRPGKDVFNKAVK